MNMKQRIANIVALVAVGMASVACADTPTITGVTAQQRYPWNGKVDISYTVTGDIAEEAKQRAVFPSLQVAAIDMIANTTNTATQLSGDLSLLEGTHTIVWDMDAEGLSLPFKSSNVVFKVSCKVAPAMYCVIDLSDGSNAISYPAIHMAEPPVGSFNTDEYKTTKLVLRRIEPGAIPARNAAVTRPYYIGVFEFTQRQFELVMGENPCSSSSHGSGVCCPVHLVSYETIRGASSGAGWPGTSAVDATSFMGKLRAKTGMAELDIPTAAQWEYACRAGTTTTYSYGNSADGNYMWYKGNTSSYSHEVGTRLPNPWGLYDMHGNVWEWCLDWSGGTITGNDPAGPSSGSRRRLCGGSWNGDAYWCRTVSSSDCAPSSSGNADVGFRLVRPLSTTGNEQSIDVLCFGESGMKMIDLALGARRAAPTERIRYSSAWAIGAKEDAVAVVEVNGKAISSAVGSGYVGWNPSSNGSYTLTHKVLINGEKIGESLSSTFFVDSFVLGPPVIEPNSTTYVNASQEIAIFHDVEDVAIYYTTDGSNPKENGIEYTKPFTIHKSCTVRAVAVKSGWMDSTEVTAIFTREESLGEAVNLYGYLPETNASNPWTVDATASHDGVSSVRSCAIGNGGTTDFTVATRKAGRVTFWWRAACEEYEEEDGETYYYDYCAFLVDDAVKARIAGHDTGWQFVAVDVPTGGKHVLKWKYCKDGATTYHPDCVWLDQVQWIPADGSGYTLTTPEPVPYSWLTKYNLGVVEGDFEAAANAANGKTSWGRPMSVWQDYVAGTDPTNAASRLTARIEMQGSTPVITWEPDLNTNGAIRIYKVHGRETLEEGGNWQYPINSLHRFFRVTVEMP